MFYDFFFTFIHISYLKSILVLMKIIENWSQQDFLIIFEGYNNAHI